VIFIKLIRVLAIALAVWLILHLLYSLGRKKAMSRPGGKDRAGNAHRKFVKSSIVEKQSRTDDEGQS
jgi:hypothetical protein